MDVGSGCSQLNEVEGVAMAGVGPMCRPLRTYLREISKIHLSLYLPAGSFCAVFGVVCSPVGFLLFKINHKKECVYETAICS